MSIAVGEAHILNICVTLEKRREGIAAALLRYLLKVAKKNKAHIIFLEVRVSNNSAIRLYQSFHFEQIGLRKAYYPNKEKREDALVFACKLANLV
jgi:ribosomal-protein-alanine N-acetyltransferase